MQTSLKAFQVAFSLLLTASRHREIHVGGFAPMLPRPIVAVLAITLGLPFLLLLALVSSGAGVHVGVFTSALTVVVFSIFVILMIFEIRRIVEQPPDGH